MEMDWIELLKLLGSDNVERIKQEITEGIIDNIQESIKSEWIIAPSEFDDMFDELGKEVFEEVKKKYKKELKKITCEKMENFITNVKESEAE